MVIYTYSNCTRLLNWAQNVYHSVIQFSQYVLSKILYRWAQIALEPFFVPGTIILRRFLNHLQYSETQSIHCVSFGWRSRDGIMDKDLATTTDLQVAINNLDPLFLSTRRFSIFLSNFRNASSTFCYMKISTFVQN